VSALSSRSLRPDVNAFPADERAFSHRRTVRRILHAERRIRADVGAPVSTLIPIPPQAETVLAALSRSFQPGSVVSIAQICEVSGFSQPTTYRIRRWARSVGLWPYQDAKGGFAGFRKGGGG
jgi:hypothetical protein